MIEQPIVGLAWKRSSACTETSNCVEVAPCASGIAVRDSKDPDGPVLLFTRAEIVTFLNGAKAGEFDDLVR